MSFFKPSTGPQLALGINTGNPKAPPPVEEKLTLVVPSSVCRFKAGEEGAGFAEFERHIRQAAIGSSVPIRSAKDVLLDSQYRIQGHFRFTRPALSQLCNLLASGLSTFLGDIGGIGLRGGGQREQHSLPAAVQILNDMIRLRFDSRLRGCSLILDRPAQRVEGVVGTRYNFFANVELFDRCQDFASGFSPHAEFAEAYLHGRWLLLRYRKPQALFSLPTPTPKREPFFEGWHFANSEVGDCTLHFTNMLLRGWHGSAFLRPFEAWSRIVHIRSQHFAERFNQGLRELVAGSAQVAQLEADLSQVTNQSLRLGGSRQAHEARVRTLLEKLANAGLSDRIARATLNRLLGFGSYNAQQLELPGQPLTIFDPSALAIWQHRSVFDLGCSLGHVALSQPPERRELLEQLAYRVLDGSLSFV